MRPMPMTALCWRNGSFWDESLAFMGKIDNFCEINFVDCTKNARTPCKAAKNGL